MGHHNNPTFWKISKSNFNLQTPITFDVITVGPKSKRFQRPLGATKIVQCQKIHNFKNFQKTKKSNFSKTISFGDIWFSPFESTHSKVLLTKFSGP